MPPSPRRSRSGCDPLARIYHVAGRARFPLWESMIIEVPLRYPITGIAPCSARAASGHATAAPPSSVMNERRLV